MFSIWTVLAFGLGLVVVGVVWTVVHNRKNHPGKVEGIVKDAYDDFKDRIG